MKKMTQRMSHYANYTIMHKIWIDSTRISGYNDRIFSWLFGI